MVLIPELLLFCFHTGILIRFRFKQLFKTPVRWRVLYVISRGSGCDASSKFSGAVGPRAENIINTILFHNSSCVFTEAWWFLNCLFCSKRDKQNVLNVFAEIIIDTLLFHLFCITRGWPNGFNPGIAFMCFIQELFFNFILISSLNDVYVEGSYLLFLRVMSATRAPKSVAQ